MKEDKTLIHDDYCTCLLKDFLDNSWSTIKVLAEAISSPTQEKTRRKIMLFQCDEGQKKLVEFDDDRFFLRGSIEYSNPQLTVEEVQGVIGTRMLEVCANYFAKCGLHQPDANDIVQLCEALKKPPEGYIVPFLLNTDDVELDRYSMNPLKNSIVESGQSAFPAAYVNTDQLKVDWDFVKKYEGTLITKKEAEFISENLESTKGNYLDFVDCVKHKQLEDLSKLFGMDLSLYSLRMPLSTLQTEGKDGLLHYIISESHRDYNAIKEAYSCMGRSMSKRTTLLTVPHSKKGYGSKRAARGKIHFDDSKLRDVNVKYQNTELYPNDIDPKDVAVAKASDDFTVPGEKLANYNFEETPSSPQFFLYSLGSPEDAAVWHGVGLYASPQLLQSYASARKVCRKGTLMANISQKYNIKLDVPLQFNLTPNSMWSHPVHRNIDASIGTVENIKQLVRQGMRLEYLSAFK
ncbi:MAG: hypothetical protein NWE95_09030 [Candidatus Bathyarchaeota archaeon]|nr:hypothetical protein [Candidatus Bathyarchaeota archaeon]